MTRAEHIAVVPFRLAMRKSRRANQPAPSELLHDRDGALAHERDRLRLGEHAVARDAEGGVGCTLRVAVPSTPLKRSDDQPHDLSC